MRTELSTLRRGGRDLSRWLRGRPETSAGAHTFGYGTQSLTMLKIGVTLTVLEFGLVEWIVPWTWLRIVLGVVALIGVAVMAAMVAGYRVRPHLIDGSALVLRCGAAWEVQIPFSAIDSVRRVLGTSPGRPGIYQQTLHLGIGTDDVEVIVNPASVEPGDPIRIRCSADRPEALVDAVRSRLVRSR